MTTFVVSRRPMHTSEPSYWSSPHADNIKRAVEARNAAYRTSNTLSQVGEEEIEAATPVALTKTLEEQLFDALAYCKIDTRRFAMLFDKEWHTKLFRQLDLLMDIEEWDARDEPVSRASFRTLLRLLMTFRDKRRPGLGIANNGNIVATWSAGRGDRVSIECMPNDRVRWVLTRPLEENTETVVGLTNLSEIRRSLAPYDPEHWLANDEIQPSGK